MFDLPEMLPMPIYEIGICEKSLYIMITYCSTIIKVLTQLQNRNKATDTRDIGPIHTFIGIVCVLRSSGRSNSELCFCHSAFLYPVGTANRVAYINMPINEWLSYL